MTPPTPHRGSAGRKPAGNRSQPRRAQGNGRRGAGPAEHDPDGVRLQKVLAAAGYGSRRACEDIIVAGRVTVDGKVARELGIRVDPTRSAIHVDGVRVLTDTKAVTVALNKPAGVVSTMSDPEGRPTLADYVANRTERLFHVGRLDAESEGLILLTTDGELANRLAHPSYEVAKTYIATVTGQLGRSAARQLRDGIELEDGPVEFDECVVVDSAPGLSMVKVVLHSGRNRIVRRAFEEVGHPVQRLVRTQIGPIRLGDLPPGRTRVLGRTELGTLMAAVGL